MELDARAVQLAKEEEECRRNLNLATKNYNAALDAERKAKEAIDKQKELDDNFTELSNQVNLKIFYFVNNSIHSFS